MAKTAVTPQQISRSGLEATYGAPNASGSGGNSVVNDGQTFLHVKNASGGSITVTIKIPVTTDGQAVADRTVAIANSKDKFIGPFPVGVYNQTDGAVYFDCGASATGITLAALRF